MSSRWSEHWSHTENQTRKRQRSNQEVNGSKRLARHFPSRLLIWAWLATEWSLSNLPVAPCAEFTYMYVYTARVGHFGKYNLCEAWRPWLALSLSWLVYSLSIHGMATRRNLLIKEWKSVAASLFLAKRGLNVAKTILEECKRGVICEDFLDRVWEWTASDLVQMTAKNNWYPPPPPPSP